MNHDMKLFIVFYGLSCIPWGLAFYSDIRDIQLGLFIIDGLLTVLAYVYLWQGVGGWWTLFAFILNGGIGYVLRGLGLNSYDLVLSKRKG